MKKYVKIALESFFDGCIKDRHLFYAHRNLPFCIDLNECRTELDLKVKVLSWFSEGAAATAARLGLSETARSYMLDCINLYLDTNFSYDDMSRIYAKFNHEFRGDLALLFIASGYNMDHLKETEQETQSHKMERILSTAPMGSLWTLSNLDSLADHIVSQRALVPSVMINDIMRVDGVDAPVQIIKIVYTESGFEYEWFAHTNNGGIFGSITDADIGVTAFFGATMEGEDTICAG